MHQNGQWFPVENKCVCAGGGAKKAVKKPDYFTVCRLGSPKPPLFSVSQMGEVARVSGSEGVMRWLPPSVAARQLPHPLRDRGAFLTALLGVWKIGIYQFRFKYDKLSTTSKAILFWKNCSKIPLWAAPIMRRIRSSSSRSASAAVFVKILRFL